MGSCFARNLGGNLFKDVADARNESSDHRNLSTEHTEDTDFLSTEGTEDTDHRILSTEHTEDTDHRNLDGIYTDGLGLPVGKKSLEEIFNKNMACGQK